MPGSRPASAAFGSVATMLMVEAVVEKSSLAIRTVPVEAAELISE